MKFNIRARRIAEDLTQQQLSERTGVPQTTISYLETAANDPNFQSLLPIAAYFGIKVEELIEPDDTDQTA